MWNWQKPGKVSKNKQKNNRGAGSIFLALLLIIAAIAGIILNAILPGNDYNFGVNPEGDQSRGVYVSNTDNK